MGRWKRRGQPGFSVVQRRAMRSCGGCGQTGNGATGWGGPVAGSGAPKPRAARRIFCRTSSEIVQFFYLPDAWPSGRKCSFLPKYGQMLRLNAWTTDLWRYSHSGKSSPRCPVCQTLFRRWPGQMAERV